MSSPTTPRSTCRLEWCTSQHDPQTHPVLHERGRALTTLEYKVARARYLMQQRLAEAYEAEGPAGLSVAFYQDYIRSRGWSQPVPHDSTIANTPPAGGNNAKR